MANAADYVLKLIDRVTGPARAMARSLGSVTAAQKAVKQASAGAQAGLTGVGAAAARAGKQAAAAAASVKALAYSTSAIRFKSVGGRALAGSLSELGSFSGAMHGPVFDRKAQRSQMSLWDNLKIDSQPLRKWNSAMGETLDKWGDLRAAFMKTPFGLVLGGLGSIASGLFSVISSIGMAILKVGALTLALGTLVAVGLTKGALAMAAFAERSKQAFGFLIGDKALGRAAFDVGVSLAKELGLNVEETVGQLSKLRSMQFSMRESVELVKLSADLKAITGDSQSAERALTALTQIKAKGKLQSEELVGQLAEAGVSTVLVYQELEKLLGKDRNGVLKALQGGNIDADTGIAAIKAAILHKLNAKEAGQVGKDFANNTLTGLWEQLRNAPSNFLLSLESLIDTDSVKGAIREILRAFEGIGRGNVGAFVNKIIAGFSKMVPVVIAFGEGFGSAFGKVLDAMTFDGAGVQDKAREAGRWLAEFFGNAITLVGKLTDVLPRAFESFMKGLDLNGLLDDIASADWSKFAQDLAAIASALGKITGFGASAARVLALGPDQSSTTEKTLSAVKDILVNPFSYDTHAKNLFGLFSGGEEKTAPQRPGAAQQGGRSVTVPKIEQHIYTSTGADPREIASEVGGATVDGLQSVAAP